MNISRFAIIVALTALGGCAAQPTALPKNYSGPTALIADSTYTYSARKSDFFYVESIDGQAVLNSLDRTAGANRGRGLRQSVVDASRPIEPRPTVFHIVGATHFAAPILAIGGTSYYVDGDVSFTPVAGTAYVVKGSLGPDYSSVWVENKDTGAQVGNKLLIKGAAQINPLQKRREPEQVPPP